MYIQFGLFVTILIGIYRIDFSLIFFVIALLFFSVAIAVFLIEINIRLFKEYYENSNENFSSEEIVAIKKLFSSENIKEKINSCLDIVSIGNSFLKEKYPCFYFESLRKEWGNI